MKILLLEDDPILSEILEEHLIEKQYTVKVVSNGVDAEDATLKERFDLFIFDVNVPSLSGFELLKSLRGLKDSTPTIFITSLNASKDVARGFELGANDYLKKPFDLEELDARILNIKRTFSIDTSLKIDDETIFFPQAHTVKTRNEEMVLRKKEGEILEYLLKNRGKIISNDELLSNIWSYEETPDASTLRTYIKNLRKALKKDLIQNIRGEGYTLDCITQVKTQESR